MKKIIFLFASICITVSSFAYPRINVGYEQINPTALGWNVQQYEQPITSVDVTGSTLNWFAEAYFGPTNWYNTAPPSGCEMMAAGSIHAYEGSIIRGGSAGWYGIPNPRNGSYTERDYLGNLYPIGVLQIKGVKSHSYGDVYIDLSW